MKPKNNKYFIQKAINLSLKGVKNNEGGPFGAVIVKDGEIISEGNNKVVSQNDPTMHAEIVAIRRACEKLGRFNLSDCKLYASCEPCPMCLGAIYWAHIDKIFYANTKEDAKNIGFDDEFIYKELNLKKEKRKLKMTQLMHDEAFKIFEKWEKKDDRIYY